MSDTQERLAEIRLTEDDVEVIKSAWVREVWNSVSEQWYCSCNYCDAPEVNSADDEVKHAPNCILHKLTSALGEPAPAPALTPAEVRFLDDMADGFELNGREPTARYLREITKRLTQPAPSAPTGDAMRAEITKLWNAARIRIWHVLQDGGHAYAEAERLSEASMRRDFPLTSPASAQGDTP